jgi:predicted acyltransferase
MLGMFTGELIRLPKERMSGEKKALWMVVGAVALLVVTIIFKGVLPINKMLWSSTFVCAVGSYSLFMMAIFYYIVDVRGWQKWTFVFRVVGMNSITIYLAQRMINFSHTNKFLFSGLAGLFPDNINVVIINMGYIVVCWLFLYFLYRKNTFLKV